MRIVQINSVCDVGSTGRIAADLARKANANGDEVICAYGRKKSDAQDIKAVRIGNDFDIICHVIATRLFDRHGLASKKATKKFLKQMDEFLPEMFHLHNLHGYYINYPLLFDYIKKNDIKVRWTLHDSWPFTGHCAGPSYYDCFKFREDCSDCPYRAEYPGSVMVCRSKKNFREKKEAFLGVKDMTIITPSKWFAGLVKQSFLGNYEVQVVHNTIDTHAFRPRESDFRKRYHLEGKKIYLCVSFVWLDEKLNALKAVASQLVDDEVIVLVGVTSKDKKKIKSSKMIGIEKTDSKTELAEIYSAADVFINPTVRDDNYPTVNLEAQACGTFVVTYDSGGAPETITPGMGCTVPFGDTGMLLEKAREYA